MKFVIWNFVIEKQVSRVEIGDALRFFSAYMRDYQGLYHASFDGGAHREDFVAFEELESCLLDRGGGGVKVYLQPQGWEFEVDFNSEGGGAEESISAGRSADLAEVSITTNMIWTESTQEEQTSWEESFRFLAESVIKATHPLWGVRLHEWDYEQIISTQPMLLEYRTELRNQTIPKLLGPVTYMNKELLAKAPLRDLPNLEIRWVNSFGAFVLIPSPQWQWQEVLESWITQLQKSL